MQLLRLARQILLVLPVALAGLLRAPAPPDPAIPAPIGPAVFVSAPRQSIPAPVHNEATCAFCQAVAFTPYAARPTDRLPELSRAERYEQVSSDCRLIHSASSSPPRSRGPPTLRNV
ncbi:MAG: hypothetical protein ACJ8BF_10565 [Gemmatimonadales bacterium]